MRAWGRGGGAPRKCRVLINPVQKWFPGRGSAFQAPPARIYYSSRLRANLGWWREQRPGRAILNVLKNGVKIDFHSPPPPFKLAPLLVDNADIDFAVADLAKGDSLGAYQPLLPGGEQFLSRSRIDTRPGSGKQRVVHNYRRINDYTVKRTCRYESVKDLSHLLRAGDWLLSLDVSGAFWHIPLHIETAHYLSFHFALPEFVTDLDGSRRAVPLQPGAYWVQPPQGPRYQVVERTCRATPFGFTNSPYLWTKVIKVLAKAMRSAGIRCLWFVDDALLALPSRAAAFVARSIVEDMFLRSGLSKAPDKGVWIPTQCLPDHLGFEISTAGPHGSLKVPVRRCLDLSRSAKDLLCRAGRDTRFVPSDLLRTFIGKAASIVAACSQARFRLRSLHDVAELWSARSRLDRAATRDLQWWLDFAYASPANGLPLWPAPPTRAIFTDASSTLGYGAVLKAPFAARKNFGGWWSLTERQQYHITFKELLAVRKGIEAFAPDLRGRVVRLWEDNQAVVHIIRNKTSRSPLLMAELRLLLQLLDDLHIRLEPRYIRSELNPADEFSRLTDRDAWSLVPSVQRMLLAKVARSARMPVSLDPFACHQSKVCARFASRRSDPEALAFDGCALDWRSEVVWINPPWALLPDIIGKIDSERPAGVLIVPVWPSQVWWPRLLQLPGTHLDLPPPKFSVQALHGRKVEPFLHPGLRLRAVVLRPGILH